MDDEKNEIQQHQELKLTRRIDSKRILNFGNWRTTSRPKKREATELGVHLSQRIKLKYHKINCFGPDYVVQNQDVWNDDRIASGLIELLHDRFRSK